MMRADLAHPGVWITYDLSKPYLGCRLGILGGVHVLTTHWLALTDNTSSLR
jgi:hypothetical protein